MKIFPLLYYSGLITIMKLQGIIMMSIVASSLSPCVCVVTVHTIFQYQCPFVMFSPGNNISTVICWETGRFSLFEWEQSCISAELVNKRQLLFRSSWLIYTFKLQLKRKEQRLWASLSIHATAQRRGTKRNGLSWKNSLLSSHSCTPRPPISLPLFVPPSPFSSLLLLPHSGRAFNMCGWKGQLCERPALSSHPQDASACLVQ